MNPVFLLRNWSGSSCCLRRPESFHFDEPDLPTPQLRLIILLPEAV
jgi:hypothetical protein